MFVLLALSSCMLGKNEIKNFQLGLYILIVLLKEFMG